MSWSVEMTIMLRHMIDDLSEDSPTYSDYRLEELLLVSGILLQTEVGQFLATYQINIEEHSINPDPTAIVDGGFMSLATLKAACIIERSEAKAAAGKARSFREAGSSMDKRGVAQARLAILQKGGWCSAYENAKFSYQAGDMGAAGIAVLSPFRTIYTNLPYSGYFGLNNPDGRWR
jgi:hypothetical protein